MADFVRIVGVPPYDGDHPIDVSYFTNRELHTIKEIAGVRAGQIEQAFADGDTDLVVALAIIALARAGHVRVDRDRLWDAEVGKIDLVLEEDDVSPPASALPSESGGNERNGEPPSSSGQPLKIVGEDLRGKNLSSTGSPDSATGAASDLETSAS